MAVTPVPNPRLSISIPYILYSRCSLWAPGRNQCTTFHKLLKLLAEWLFSPLALFLGNLTAVAPNCSWASLVMRRFCWLVWKMQSELNRDSEEEVGMQFNWGCVSNVHVLLAFKPSVNSLTVVHTNYKATSSLQVCSCSIVCIGQSLWRKRSTDPWARHLTHPHH